MRASYFEFLLMVAGHIKDDAQEVSSSSRCFLYLGRAGWSNSIGCALKGFTVKLKECFTAS
ncbi:8730_t:CDS:2 [Rhizophagus irregularis]|nr:8730_t:CDS:2 [Rhizophagus irregularis]